MKQYLQYIWLFLTAVSASGTFGLGLILRRSYGRTSEMRFFLYVALAFFAITFETLCAETRPIAVANVSYIVPGLIGRLIESGALWWVIWYLLGGQNSHVVPVPVPMTATATTTLTVEHPELPVEHSSDNG